MKYCSHCGKEIADEAVVCIGCGCAVQNTQTDTTLSATDTSEKKTKFCSNCGKEIDKNAVICIGCGCAVADYQKEVTKDENQQKEYKPSGLKKASIILISITIVLQAVACLIFIGYLIDLYVAFPVDLFKEMFLYLLPCLIIGILPLAWYIPMALNLAKKTEEGEPISTGFKVLILIFVNLIAGILLLCDKD